MKHDIVILKFGRIGFSVGTKQILIIEYTTTGAFIKTYLMDKHNFSFSMKNHVFSDNVSLMFCEKESSKFHIEEFDKKIAHELVEKLNQELANSLILNT